MRCLLALLICVGCDDGGSTPPAMVDGDIADGMVDTAPDAALDAAPVDARVVDQAVVDAEPADQGPDPDGSPVDAGPDQGLRPCDPPLAIEPATVFVAAFDGVEFTASGGTGRWRFDFVEAPSGGILNPLSGAYIGGPTLGVTDTIRLTDAGCIGAVEAVAHVVDPLELRPSAAEVGVGVAFDFDTLGGSGETEFELIASASGGALDADGRYVAGDTPGEDRVMVRDPLTGLTAEAVLTVIEDPQLRLDPPRLFMGTGSGLSFETIGGSGHLDLEPDDAGAVVALDADAKHIAAVAPGRARITARDRYTGVARSLIVDVADPLTPALRRAGRALFGVVLEAPGDLNGDGFADAVVAHPGAHLDGFTRGAVAVYHGGPDGLEPAPVQVFGGPARDDQFGRGMAVGDLDGDGRPDLLVGNWGDDARDVNAGAVRVWSGDGDGRFAAAASQEVFGPAREDRMGPSLAVCDFNGDDWLDVAVDVHNYNDPSLGAAGANQGGVMVFLGGPDGLTAEPDGGIALGLRLDAEGILQPQRDMRIGFTLAAGDVNGDMLCDLVVNAQGYSAGQGRREDGAIYVYLGRAVGSYPEAEDPGGIEPIPVQIIVADEADVREGRLGRRLRVADLNGDGRADIIAGQHTWDGDGNDRGAVRVFAGGPLPGPVEAITSSATAAWTVGGANAGDTLGLGFDVADWDGDGVPDLVVGAGNGEAPPPEGEPAINNTGAVLLFRGNADAWPSVEAELLVAGAAAGDQFGEAVRVLGDANGDATPDLLVFAQLDDSLGPDVGRAYFVDGATRERTPLDLPGGPSATHFGRGVAIDAGVWIAGAPDHAFPPHRNGGAAWIGRPDQAPLLLEGHPGHSASDRFGATVTQADFDGDGVLDAIVAAPNDERPGNFPPEWQIEGECGGGNDRGIVYVYRGGLARADTPDFMLVGGQPGALMGEALAAGDMDGDGRADVVAGGSLADGDGLTDQGGVQLFYGRAADPEGRTQVVCAPDYVWRSGVDRARAGFALAWLGDVTDDGCPEIAIGAFNARVDAVTGGAVFIMQGFGRDGCPAEPAFAALSPRAGGAQFGVALAAGNLLRDPRGDLVIGAAEIQEPQSRQRRGAVFLVDGADLAALPFDGTVQPVPPDAHVVYGRDDASDFGRSLAVAGDTILVGHPFGGVLDDRSRQAGATLLRFGDAALEPAGRIVGETDRIDSRLGLSIAAARDGMAAIIGALFGGTDTGSAYRFALTEME